MLLDEGGESGVDLAFVAGLQNMELQPFCARRFPHVSDHALGDRTVRVHEHGNYLGQKRGYPDLAPLSLALAPEKAFPLALATAKKMSWTIVEADPTTRRIEASERSFRMGFTDDIVVRVAEAGSGSRIDVRSASRHGRSDLGVNDAGIRTYLAALHEAKKPGN